MNLTENLEVKQDSSWENESFGEELKVRSSEAVNVEFSHDTALKRDFNELTKWVCLPTPDKLSDTLLLGNEATEPNN